MKKIYFIICLFFATTITLKGQTSLLANYPLTENGLDITGQNDAMHLKNVVFENGGVYSNGIYSGNDTTGSEILTPPFTTFNYNNFTVMVDFKIESYPIQREPIIIGGYLWRWIGAYLDDGKLAFMANDFSIFDITDVDVLDNQWNNIRFSYNTETDTCYFYYNNALVSTYYIETLNTGDDPRFGITHGGVGETFEGYWRNLVIYNSSNIDGVKETNMLNNISISFAGNHLKVNVPWQSGPVEADITDMQGRTIKTVPLSSGLNSIYLNKTEGLFLVVLHDKNGATAVRKIVVSQ